MQMKKVMIVLLGVLVLITISPSVLADTYKSCGLDGCCCYTFKDCQPNLLSPDPNCTAGHYADDEDRNCGNCIFPARHPNCRPDDPAYGGNQMGSISNVIDVDDGLDNDCDGTIDNEPCDGIDNDKDNMIDESVGSCLAKFVFVAACWEGSDSDFQKAAQQQLDAFYNIYNLNDCKDTFNNLIVSKEKINLKCPWYYPDDKNPCLQTTIWYDEAKKAIQDNGILLGDYNEIIALTRSDACTEWTSGGGNAGMGFMYFAPSQATWTLSHEIGHDYDLDDEYCTVGLGGHLYHCTSSKSINHLGSDLGCSPLLDVEGCCFRSCKDWEKCCMGNMIDPSGPTDPFEGNRCTMAGNANGFCPRCEQQITDPIDIRDNLNPIGQVPLQCGYTNPVGPQNNLDIAFTLTESGKLQIDSFDTYIGRSSLAGTSTLGTYAIKVQREGTTIYSTNFIPFDGVFDLGTAFGGETGFSHILRVAAPSDLTATEPLQILIYKDGILTSESTINGQPPVANAGPDQIVECTGSSQATVTLDASASSDLDGDTLLYAWSAPGITFTNPTGKTTIAVFPLGTTIVTLTVNDGSLQPANTDTVKITIKDTIPPVLTPPAATTIFTCKNPNIGTATAVDTCGGTAVTITNNAPATFPLGETTVTWTAKDTFGNLITAKQKVTAILGDDPSCCPAGYNVIVGTPKDDDLIGTFGNDCILGLAGSDTLNGKKGNDVLSGGEGRDTLVTDDGTDYLASGPGRDNLNAGKGKDICVVDRTDNVVNCEKLIYYP